jgi:acyl dehydratase
MWENIARLSQFAGLLVIVSGLWFCARGMRVVVSGRMDERRRSASSLKLGLPLLILGILLLLGGSMLGNRTLLQ